MDTRNLREAVEKATIVPPHTFLNSADHATHQGERPMSNTSRLRHPMPAELTAEMKVATG